MRESFETPNPGSLSLVDPPRQGEGEESTTAAKCNCPAAGGEREFISFAPTIWLGSY